MPTATPQPSPSSIATARARVQLAQDELAETLSRAPFAGQSAMASALRREIAEREAALHSLLGAA